ncbi:MAG: sel1 repeat family protein [Desulfovibrionaceae bacterium]
MPTILRSTPDRGAGFAVIHLDVGDASLPSMPQGCAFSLQRASDSLFLAEHDWQESHSEQIPDSIQRQGDVLELCVGPHVVDNMDVLNTYRIHLRHTCVPPSVIHVESLDYSPLKGKEGFAMPGASAVPAPPVVVPEPEPEPEPDPEPAQPESLPLSMALPEPPAKRTSALVWIALGLVLLLALGGAVYYWYSQQKIATPQTESSAPPAAPEHPASAPATAAKSAPATPPEALTPLAQARKQLQSHADAAQNLALARTLQAAQPADAALAAQHADAVFLLVEDAAQKGSAEAMLLLGRYFDPVDNAPKGSIQSDPQQALQWYTQARTAGQTEAADKALTALRAWAKAAAAQGDKNAQKIVQTPAMN